MRKKSFGFIFLVILFGALVGTALGEVLGFILPSGVVKDFFLSSFEIGLQTPFTLNLIIVKIIMGVTLKINIIGGLGIILVAYFLRWYD